jgi:Holliday junction resolvasome RuvABC ATP-dependent DNA helicase subunit
MKKQQKQKTINNDVQGDFLKDINIWSIQGQDHVVNKLKILVQEYHNNKSEGRNPNIKNILLSGNHNSGKSTLAHAYSNSLCCSKLYETDGSSLAMGGACIYDFLKQGDSQSAYLINSVELLSSYCCYILNIVMQTNTLIHHDYLDNKPTKYHFNKLLIFSTIGKNGVNHQLVKNVDMWFNINNIFMDNEIHRALSQRISYLEWEIEEQDKLIRSIVSVVHGEIGRAIDLLGWSYSCCRAEGEDKIALKHLNGALHLLGK